jgi:L-alanine-DL-glutamate epimerase-like enolase superfamily enzyme
MIIDRIEPIALRLPVKRQGGPDALYLVLCKVTVRSGLVGYGECLCLFPSWQRSLVAAIRDAVAPLFLGKSVEDRERLNVQARIRMASFGRAGTNLNALAAVDMALWDIAGKASGRSLSTLLGGRQRTRVPVMASLDPYNDIGKVGACIDRALEAEVAAVKIHESDLPVIEAARKAAGQQMPFVADCNNSHTIADIQIQLSRWQALNLLWFEDPVWPPESLLDSPNLARIVVGMGADLGSAEQLAMYAKAVSVGVLQPDICMIGGVSEAKRAMAMLGPLGKLIAPHTPFIGPAGLANLHFLATMNDVAYYAVIDAEPHMDMYGDSGLTRWQPDLSVPTGPGLGLDPNPAYLKTYSVDL